MGLMSLDEWDMSLLLHTNPEDEDEVKGAKTADEREQKLTAMKNQQAYAEKINPLIADHYFGERCIPHALNPTNHHCFVGHIIGSKRNCERGTSAFPRQVGSCMVGMSFVGDYGLDIW